MNPINQQTPGPVFSSTVNKLHLLSQRQSLAVVSSCDDMAGNMVKLELYEREKANARLLASSYSAFNSAGRALGIDASLLAESIDLAALIRATNAALRSLDSLASEVFDHHTPLSGLVDPRKASTLCDARAILSKLPKPQSV